MCHRAVWGLRMLLPRALTISVVLLPCRPCVWHLEGEEPRADRRAQAHHLEATPGAHHVGKFLTESHGRWHNGAACSHVSCQLQLQAGPWGLGVAVTLRCSWRGCSCIRLHQGSLLTRWTVLMRAAAAGRLGHATQPMCAANLASASPCLSSSLTALAPCPAAALQVAREGTKKTVFTNFMDMCRAMNRQQEHVSAYLLAELGTSGSLDGQQRLVIKGRFLPKSFETVLRRYVNECVGLDWMGVLGLGFLGREEGSNRCSLGTYKCQAVH